MTLEGVEIPRSLVDKDMQEKIRSMPEEFQPATPKGPDPKWRYMWRVGSRPANTRFKVLIPLWSYLCDVKILALRLRFLCDLFCVLSKTRNWHAPFIVDAKVAIWLFWLLRCNYPCLGAEL